MLISGHFLLADHVVKMAISSTFVSTTYTLRILGHPPLYQLNQRIEYTNNIAAASGSRLITSRWILVTSVCNIRKDEILVCHPMRIWYAHIRKFTTMRTMQSWQVFKYLHTYINTYLSERVSV